MRRSSDAPTWRCRRAAVASGWHGSTTAEPCAWRTCAWSRRGLTVLRSRHRAPAGYVQGATARALVIVRDGRGRAWEPGTGRVRKAPSTWLAAAAGGRSAWCTEGCPRVRMTGPGRDRWSSELPGWSLDPRRLIFGRRAPAGHGGDIRRRRSPENRGRGHAHRRHAARAGSSARAPPGTRLVLLGRMALLRGARPAPARVPARGWADPHAPGPDARRRAEPGGRGPRAHGRSAARSAIGRAPDHAEEERSPIGDRGRAPDPVREERSPIGDRASTGPCPPTGSTTRRARGSRHPRRRGRTGSRCART